MTTNALDRLAQAEAKLQELKGARQEPNSFRWKAQEFVAMLRSVQEMLVADYGVPRSVREVDPTRTARPGFNAWYTQTKLAGGSPIDDLRKRRNSALHDHVQTSVDFGDFDTAVKAFETQACTAT
jgi:hypothetical protein